MTNYTPASHQLVKDNDGARIQRTLRQLVDTIELKPLLLKMLGDEYDGLFIPFDMLTCKGLSLNEVHLLSLPVRPIERFIIPIKDRAK